MGAAELFLEKDTSLLNPSKALPREVPIAILERQINSLGESKWKPAIAKVVDYLLDDLLYVLGDTQPVRRAKVLIGRLEHMYYSGNPMQSSRVEELTNEIRQLLDLVGGLNSAYFILFLSLLRQVPNQFKTARFHYSALAHLWLTLIAHSNTLPDCNGEKVLGHSNEAHGHLVSLLSTLGSPVNSSKFRTAQRESAEGPAAPSKPQRKPPAGGRIRTAKKVTRAGRNRFL